MRRRRKTPSNPTGGATAAIHRRARKKPKGEPKTSGVVVPFTDDEVLKPALKGPVLRNFRHDTHIHVSDIIHQCPRRLAIAKKYKRPLANQQLFDSLGLTFAIGDAMHDYIRGKIADRMPGSVYANWSCACGGATYRGLKDKANTVQGPCVVCNRPLDTHGEIVLLSKQLNLTGSIDLSLIVDNALLITEIKSMTKTTWGDLARPLPDHVIQVLFYWKIARELKLAVHDKVIIIYAQKEYAFHNPYKEFVLQPSTLMGRLDDYLDDAQALADVYADPEGAPLPKRVECSSPELQKAKDCEMHIICFAVD